MSTSVKSAISFSGSEIENSTKSFTCSKKYLMKILQFSLINIMYRRIQLPEEDFEEQNMKDMKFMICKKSSKHPLIHQYYDWIKGARHALENDYLKEFYFIFKNNDGVVLEFYKFHFFYNFDGVEKKDRVDPKILYEVTKQIFDDIQCLSVYEKWDANSKFSVMVKYNDHVPRTYRPPFFGTENISKDSDEDERAIKSITQRTKLFRISTGFHSLKAVFGADKSIKKIINSPSHSADTSVVSRDDEDEENKQDDSNKNKSLSSLSSSAAEKTAFCICQSSIKHKALKIIHCTICKKPFHCVCFGFLEAPTEQFKCVTCGGSAHKITSYDTDEKVRIRLLIGFCKLTMEAPQKIMKGFHNKEERKQLWHNLSLLRVITKKNEKYIVNRAKITDVKLLKEMFRDVIEDSMEMVDLTEENEETASPVPKKAKCE